VAAARWWRGSLSGRGGGTTRCRAGLAVGLGALGRSWDAPAQLLATASAWQTTIVSTLSSLIFNNLPAAVLLSAHAPVHPGALLVGLNLGPNIAVTGSLSAYLWFKVSRDAGVLPSIKTYTRVGALTAIVGIPLALGALAAFAPARL
jgi:arsenical pump membrane protein